VLSTDIWIYILLQVIEEPTRRGAIMDLVLTNKEGLVGNVKVKDSPGCSAVKGGV